jgi:hypothetical protein
VTFLAVRWIFNISRQTNRFDATGFEGVYLICRLWEKLSLQVGEINAKKFATARNMA